MRAISSLVAAAVAAGCSVTTLDVTECDTNAECRAQFGFGAVCGGGGLCEQSPRLARCNETFPADLFFDTERHADTVVVGNLMDQSLATHRARERSARLAIKQVNGAGGIEGRQLGIVFCTIEEDEEFDFDTRQEAAVSSARYLIETLGVPAIIGPASSDDVQLVFQEFADTGTLFISPSATSPALSALDPQDVSDRNPGLLWRTAPPDSLQGAAIAYDMYTPGAGRAVPVSDVAVVHHTGAYGAALANVFAAEFQTEGGAVELLPFTDDGQMSEAIARAATDGSAEEVLFVSSQTVDAIAFMDSAAASSGFDDKTIFLTDAAANPDLLQQADPARFDVVRGTRQAPRDEEDDLVYAAFIAAYAAEYGEDVKQFSFTANAFDAAWMIAYGAAWSVLQEEGVSGVGIARGLRMLSAGATVETRPSTWLDAVSAFRDGRSVDISGASGELDYDPATEETSGTIQTWTIVDGDIVGVDTWPPSGD